MDRFSAVMALAVTAAYAVPAAAQDKEFNAAEGLYAAFELNQGGRPLFKVLFENGWPTDEAHRKLTYEVAGETSDLLVSVYLGSGAGLPLSASELLLAKKAAQEKVGIKHGGPAEVLSKDLRLYRSLSGYEPSVRSFSPIFLPYRRAMADLTGNWDEDDLGSWAWKKPTDPAYSLRSLGFALLAEAAFVREQLGEVRRAEQQGRQVKFLGRTPRDGFMALVALHSASAKIDALSHSLLLDFAEQRLVTRSSISGVDPKAIVFPYAFTAKESGGAAKFELAEVEHRLKSRLGAQAAVLLGAAELMTVAGHEASSDLESLFKSRTIDKQTVTLFPKTLAEDTIKVAIFAFRSMAKLHVSVRGQGSASSIADRYNRGGTITPVDLGLFLMSLEAFVTKVTLPEKGRSNESLRADLKKEHDRARTLISSLSSVIRTWQQDQPGFYDSYSVKTSSRQLKTKSLASQGFAIRGLLATHRTLKARPGSAHLRAAEAAVRWLDTELWDEKAQAYLEKGKRGERSAPLFGAAAVLGALREMALETKDGRYLVRYQQFLESLEGKGLIREAAGRIAPGLVPEVKF